MISLSASHREKPELRIHGGTTLTAEAGGIADVTWLTLENELGDNVVIFLPPRFSEALAAAINRVNSDFAYQRNKPISEPST